MDIQQVLARTNEVYEKLHTYSDVGQVESPDGPGPGLEFQTFFKRPMLFKFRWLAWHPYFGKSKPASEHMVSTNGLRFQSLFHGQIREHESLSIMVAGATGISRGSVHLMLNMLAPKSIELNQYWNQVTNPTFLPDEQVNGADCFHITGDTKNEGQSEVWLEKKTFLIRRLREKSVITREIADKMTDHNKSTKNIESFKAMAEKAGLLPDSINLALEHMAEPVKPRTFEHVYDYTTVSINEDIANSVFEL